MYIGPLLRVGSFCLGLMQKYIFKSVSVQGLLGQDKAINIKWSKKISSEDLYNKTKQGKLSAEIKTKRLWSYGYVI